MPFIPIPNILIVHITMRIHWECPMNAVLTSLSIPSEIHQESSEISE